MFGSQLTHLMAVAVLTASYAFTSVAAEPERLTSLGTDMIIKIDSQKTGGALSVVESVVAPGSGPPKHVHSKEDELFYVVEGTFRMWRGSEVLEVGQGGVAFLPRNVPHTFQNIGKTPGRLLVTITPGGFENFFREVSKRQLSAPKDMAELTKISAQYGLEFLGPPPPKPAD